MPYPDKCSSCPHLSTRDDGKDALYQDQVSYICNYPDKPVIVGDEDGYEPDHKLPCNDPS